MISQHRFNITFQPSGKSIELLSGISLMEAAWMAGINLASACGGKGKCGKCRVLISNGDVSPPDSRETEILTEEELRKGHRLACCAYAESNLEVSIPEKSIAAEIRLQKEGITGDLEIDPIIDAYDVQLKPADLANPKADFDRLIDELKGLSNIENFKADVKAAGQLSPFLRRHDWKVTCYTGSGEIIGFAPKGAPPVGLAFDLGTTKIAAYLLDLATGEELASMGLLNPQIRYGDDVISRLCAAINDKDTEGSYPSELTRVMRGSLGEIIKDLTEKAGVIPTQVADICIVGNTAMTHLLLGLPVKQLVASPYVASVNLGIDIKARDLGFNISPGAYAHILPGIGGFVGPDHVAMILASEIDRSTKTTLGIDIGTNTEIVIRRPDLPELVSLSCPSGPAFEGAHVTDGMRAARGAIEAVKLTEKDVEYRTIGDAPPIGLCGSGIIDAVAELKRRDLIDERGRFNKTDNRVKQGRQGAEFQLVPESEGHEGRGVVITQKDIDEIQLAKGAIRAGIEALLEETGTSAEMVSEVVIAGAFGSFINIANTIDINMLPYFPNARYRQIGNGAGAGVRRALISKKERARAQGIAANTRYLELTTYPNFNRKFAQGMFF
jgi:uncharacterized 2Fe-2S/4Fe-4S cluster protein (DUF4445 family)